MYLYLHVLYTFLLQIDTYSNSTNYQFVNMDRQFSNVYSGVYIHLNNFYREVRIFKNGLKKKLLK